MGARLQSHLHERRLMEEEIAYKETSYLDSKEEYDEQIEKLDLKCMLLIAGANTPPDIHDDSEHTWKAFDQKIYQKGRFGERSVGEPGYKGPMWNDFAKNLPLTTLEYINESSASPQFDLIKSAAAEHSYEDLYMKRMRRNNKYAKQNNALIKRFRLQEGFVLPNKTIDPTVECKMASMLMEIVRNIALTKKSKDKKQICPIL